MFCLKCCCQSSCEIKECPEGIETKLNHEPRDDVELLDGMDQVHDDEDKADPKGSHTDKDEPLSYGGFFVPGGGAHDTNEADHIQDRKCPLDSARHCLQISRVPSQISLYVSLCHSGSIGLVFHCEAEVGRIGDS